MGYIVSLSGGHTFPFSLSSGEKCEIGGPGAIFFSIPRKPSRKIALKAKYAFMSAPVTRISRRDALGGQDGGEMTRMEAARESYP